MRASRRRLLRIAVLTALLVAAALLAGPQGGSLADERGPNGTLALRRLLTRLGAAVGESEEPPQAPATYVLLADARGQAGTQALLDWMMGGGRLVIADPNSLVLDALGVGAQGDTPSFAQPVAPGCLLAETARVGGIQVPTRAPALVALEPATVSCFHGSSGSFLVNVRRGGGQALLLGSAGVFTNRLLGRADNAVFASQLLTGHGPVVFGTAVAPQDELEGGGLWSSMPPSAKAVVLQLGAALALFALARARRLGRPVPEAVPSPIPAAELVRARANILRSARATAHAGMLLREHVARRIATRLGLGAVDTRALAATSALRELDAEAATALGRADPGTDDELIDSARHLEDARRRLEGATR